MPTRQFSGLRHCDVEAHARQVGLRARRQSNDLARLRGVRSELAAERPVAADVGRIDAQVEFGVGLDRVHLPQLVGAVDHEPLDALRRGVDDVVARLQRIGVEHLGRGNAQLEQHVELRDRGDLEARALLDQRAQHARVGIGLHRVVRAHARHDRGKAPRLFAHDAGIDQEERLLVAVLDGLLDFIEVQARLGMRVEDVGSFVCLLSDRFDRFFGYAGTHLHRRDSLRTYVMGMSRAKKSCEPKTFLVLVMMTSCPSRVTLRKPQKHRARV
jgi:hypothetical protein